MLCPRLMGYNHIDNPEVFEIWHYSPEVRKPGNTKIEYTNENPISEKEEIKIYWNYILEYFGLK